MSVPDRSEIDWKRFHTLASGDLSLPNIKRIVAVLDRGLLAYFPVSKRLLARCGLLHFRWGREMCFSKLFFLLHERHPEFSSQAPEEARHAYNMLVRRLFSKEVAAHFAWAEEGVLPRVEMATERRLERLVAEAARFGDLEARAEACKAEIEATHGLPLPHFGTLGLERRQKLIELERTVDQRHAVLVSLEQRHAALSFSIPQVVQRLRQEAKWQERFDLLRKMAARKWAVPDYFPDERAWGKWCKEETEVLEAAERARGSVVAILELAPKMLEFTEAMRGVLPPIQSAFVDRMLDAVERRCLEVGEKAVAEMGGRLEQQKRAILAVNRTAARARAELKRQAVAPMESLYSKELLVYRDLPERAERILKELFEKELLEGQLVTNEERTAQEARIQKFFEGQLQAIRTLVDEGWKRNHELQEIDRFCADVQRETVRFSWYKDTEEECSQLIQDVHKVALSRQEIARLAPSEIGSTMARHYQAYQALHADMPRILAHLDDICRTSEMAVESSMRTIKRRLLEVFTGICPYPELAERLASARATLIAATSELVDAFFSGTISASDFRGRLVELTYEPDVLKIRNEVSYRAYRLREIRRECGHLLFELQEHARWGEIVGMGEVGEVRKLARQVREFLYTLEQPFLLFTHADSMDAIGMAFRTLWMQIEAWQPQVDEWKRRVEEYVSAHPHHVRERFFEVMDDLEEVIRRKTGSRPVLVGQLEKDLRDIHEKALWEQLKRAMEDCEQRYPYLRPLSFFLAVEKSHDRKELIEEAQALDTLLDTCRTFAKSLQYIKTFEEERVDDMLEIYEHQHLIEEAAGSSALEAWRAYADAMHQATRILEDELFLDVGLLDERALMDVDQAAILKTMQMAINWAHARIQDPEQGLLRSLDEYARSEGPLGTQLVHSLRKRLVSWAKKDAPPSIDELQSFCHALFEYKVIQGAHAGNAAFLCLKVLLELEVVVRSLGEEQPKLAHDLLCELTRFEPENETKAAMRPIVDAVFRRIEQDPGSLQEIEAELEEVEAHTSQGSREPFFYVPGFLRFFSS